MSLDPAAKALLEASAKVLPRTGTVSAQEMREVHRVLQAHAPPGPELHSVEDLVCPTPEGGVATRLYLPTTKPRALIVYFHGGGYTVGSLDGWDTALRRLALASDCAIVSVDYRLAPEHRFPAAVEDALAAVRWAGSNIENLAKSAIHLLVAGDSAGAALATVTASLVRDHGGPPIAAQILLYPGVDGDIDSAFMQRFVPPSLTREEIAWYYDQYIPDRSQRKDPRFAPLHAPDLSRLPAAFVGTVGNDLFREEADLYAQRLRDSGVEVVSKCYEGTFHGFFTTDRELLPHSGNAISDITKFVDNLFSRP
jgi:acetyl esterase/lipase